VPGSASTPSGDEVLSADYLGSRHRPDAADRRTLWSIARATGAKLAAT
jgi:hypothetical protein